MEARCILEKLFTVLSDGTDFKDLKPLFLSTVTSNDIIACGSTLLNWFIQLNWTGPKDNVPEPPQTTQEQLIKWNSWCLQEMSRDGEYFYDLVQSPYLLYLAHLLLVEQRKQHNFGGLLWSARCLYQEQQLLSVKSNSLWKELENVIEELKSILELEEKTMTIKCSTHLEIAKYYLCYYKFEQAKVHLTLAQQFAGIDINLSGALGRRTKFQDRDIAQLLVTVTKQDGGLENIPAINTDYLPKDVLLEDETLLSHVKFSDSTPLSPPTQLSSLQQAVVLGLCDYQRWSGPVHGLLSEELEAYVNFVLSQPQCWSVQVYSLYLRSILQRKKSRTVERSMLQLQELIDSNSKLYPEASVRQELFYCISLPPCWTIEKQLADTLMSMGAPLSALEIYQRLHLWEDVVTCYQSVGRQTQAERVVRERMKEDGESVKLWCLLGDTTQDPECYHRAWDLSGHRSARAQKSLGLYYLSKEKLPECIGCMEKSLEINPLQEGLWFTLGYAAGQIDDHTLSAKAFRQCVTLEPDNAEAWNNLAGAYLKKKEKLRAFNAFQEALKCNYENWKIWENYLLVSLDIRELEEVIKSYHRMLDLKQKYLDSEILRILTELVLQLEKQDALRKKLGELLARVVSETTGNSELWEVCSQYHLSSSDKTDRERGIIELQKAQRTSRQDPSWEREEKKQERVIFLTLKYSQVCREEEMAPDKWRQNMSSAKMAVQNILTTLKGLEDGLIPTELVQQLDEELQLLIATIQKLK